MILFGLALVVFSIFLIMDAGSRKYSIGFFFTGVGNILFGMTNGFTDMTPIGRLLFRIALAAYVIGIPIIGYFLYTEL